MDFSLELFPGQLGEFIKIRLPCQQGSRLVWAWQAYFLKGCLEQKWTTHL